MQNDNIQFLDLETVLFYHKQEIKRFGGDPLIRDIDGVKASLSAPQVSFDGKYLMNLFEMATAYITSFNSRHPFLDGNKRISLLCATDFLYINGYDVIESKPMELANIILQFIDKQITKEDIAKYLHDQSKVL